MAKDVDGRQLASITVSSMPGGEDTKRIIEKDKGGPEPPRLLLLLVLPAPLVEELPPWPKMPKRANSRLLFTIGFMGRSEGTGASLAWGAADSREEVWLPAANSETSFSKAKSESPGAVSFVSK